MKKYSINLILGCIIFSACTTTKPLTSNVLSSEVTDLKLLEPYSYISMIKKGNRGEIDDSLSARSKELIIKVLEDFNGQIPITGEIFLSDTAVNNNLEKEYESLMLTADENKNISNLKITPVIDKILETNNVRFGLLTVSTGFTRIRGNYGKQVVKGVGLAILTLGTYYQSPVKAYSTIYAMIVDSKEDNITFYRKSFLQDKEPLDENALKKQFASIFKGYFLPK
ncbi:MAG: hypothetical protein WCE64_14170 [Bacteroidales bacterium]